MLRPGHLRDVVFAIVSMNAVNVNAVNMNTEQLVNSINITEGPVTNMSLAISTNTRTPYSDATKVGRL